MSELLLDRPQNLHSRLGNSALARPLNSVEHAEMVSAATVKIAELLSVLQVDQRSDHNTRETPKRVARMLVNEVMKGRFVSPPKLTEFANTTSSRELIVMGPIRSAPHARTISCPYMVKHILVYAIGVQGSDRAVEI